MQTNTSEHKPLAETGPNETFELTGFTTEVDREYEWILDIALDMDLPGVPVDIDLAYPGCCDDCALEHIKPQLRKAVEEYRIDQQSSAIDREMDMVDHEEYLREAEGKQGMVTV